MASKQVRPAYLLLAVVVPPAFGLLADDGPRAYYVTTAMLVAFLLWNQRAGSHAWRWVCWLGVGIQLMSASYGMWTELGAVEPVGLVLILLGVCVVAEYVAQSEEAQCQKRNVQG